MADLLGAILLGLVQGITEFAPVSSTAHLVLLPWLLGWSSPLLNSLTFDVALHMGTLAATLAYFRRDWVTLARAWLASIRERSLAPDPWRKLAWLLVLATLPGAAAGALLEAEVESAFRTPWVIGVALIVVGLLLALAERAGSKRLGLLQVTPGIALLTGLGQAAALLPGVSRSGGTMTVSMLLGLEREAAARFSFLLAAPIMLGAGARKLGDIASVSGDAGSLVVLLVGFLTAGVTGYLSIKYLLRYLQVGTLYVFVGYRVALGVAVLALTLFRGG